MVEDRRQTHPAQWVGFRALRRGLGVGGRKRKKESKRKKQATHPAQWDGLEGIEKRVGSWGKKVKVKKE